MALKASKRKRRRIKKKIVAAPDEGIKISDATIKRLSKYYRTLQNALSKDMAMIASEEIAKQNHITSAQVRKDLSLFGAFGQRGLGYEVVQLHRNISRILGLHKVWPVCLVGAGNIGTALVHFKQFQEQGFIFQTIFDSNPQKWGQKIEGIEIRNLDDGGDIIREEKIKIAIIAVPAAAAQAVVDKLVKFGIKAILNFAPISITVPEGVTIRNENMAIEIEALSYALTNKGNRMARDKSEE